MMKEMYAQMQPKIRKKMTKKIKVAKFRLKENKRYERFRQKELKNAIETGNLNSYIAKRLPYIIKKHTKILSEVA